MLDQVIRHVGISLVQIRHLRREPPISHDLSIDRTSVWIKQYLVFICCIGILWPLVQPIFHWRVLYCEMMNAYMIVDCILDDLHPFLMNRIHQLQVSDITTQTGIHPVMISERITMLGAVVHIIFNDRIEPKRGNTE